VLAGCPFLPAPNDANLPASREIDPTSLPRGVLQAHEDVYATSSIRKATVFQIDGSHPSHYALVIENKNGHKKRVTYSPSGSRFHETKWKTEGTCNNHRSRSRYDKEANRAQRLRD
jgi:hypothetical protein